MIGVVAAAVTKKVVEMIRKRKIFTPGAYLLVSVRARGPFVKTIHRVANTVLDDRTPGGGGSDE
jgi:hypothetical protein